MDRKSGALYASIVCISIMFSRFMVDKYGVDARFIIMVVALSISIISLVVIVYKKKYLAALISLSMVIPLVLMTISIYSDNMIIGIVGVVLFFILLPITTKFAK